MKKTLLVLVTLIISAIITFVLFEAMSWYHFGDIPTRVVLIRLIAFYLVLSGLGISIIAFILGKKEKKDTDK